jgi:hypothetical protein
MDGAEDAGSVGADGIVAGSVVEFIESVLGAAAFAAS